ncbi:hypothetical protein [Phenylobacterium sp.]|uniref:hypothetical protein n=1 Tax=Phenylobacterium sp. TaxID=1871053 RepID=UPI00273195DC|nr:hypothetical protein [Phenylobacterium sp.]MDP1598709.1 hypothetical protein [Phenylobacterium sp.]
MPHPNRRSLSGHDDGPTKLKKELWRWGEAQTELKLGAKAFLNLLTSYADEEARVYVFSPRFQKLMNASPRTITNYLRKLEDEELIVKTEDRRVMPRARLPLYRLAPNDTIITMLVVGSENPADLEDGGKAGQASNLAGQVSSPGDQPSKMSRAYKNNSRSQTDIQTDAPARSGGNAGPGVQKVEAREHSRAARAVPAGPIRIPPPAKPHTADVPEWLRTDLIQALGEDWAASNLEGCGWMEKPNQLYVPSSKAHQIYRDAQHVLAKHNVKVVVRGGR